MTHDRRTFILGGLATLGLAACGGSEDEAGAPARAATLDHQFGTTRLPDAPRRVVSYGYTDADIVLALGTVPVLAQQWIPQWKLGVGPWSVPALGGETPELVSGQELQFEKIAASRPDLILAVGFEMDRTAYDKLSQIAPTVPPPKGFPAYGVPWQDASLHIGRALGREADARKLVNGAQAAFDEARDANPQLEGRTGMVVVPADNGGFSVFADTDTRGRFLKSLGLEQPAEIAELTGDAFYADVSAERTDLLESVDVVVALADSVGAKALEVPQYRDAVILRELQTTMAISASTVTSIPYALERVVPPLALALA